MNAPERLQAILNYENLNANTLADSLGFDKPQRLYDVLNGKTKNISEKLADIILNIYPYYNKVWLLTGVGSMLNEEQQDTYINKVEDVEYHLVPVVPYSAMGGTPTEFLPTGVRKNECEHIISPIKADIVVQVTGDSMAPVFPSGSRVLAVKINSEDFIEWGRIYILVTDSGFVIKQVRKSDKDGYVSCFSFNDNSIYAPFDIAINKIREWYIVKGSLALH